MRKKIRKKKTQEEREISKIGKDSVFILMFDDVVYL
jgi:hypothetical protein